MPEFKQPKKRKKTVPPFRAEKVPPPPRQTRPKKSPARQVNRVQRQKQKQKKRSSMKLYYALMLAFAGIVFAVLSVTVLFNLEEILVAEGSGYSDSEIIRASELELGQNIIRLSTKTAEQKIQDKLIWLDSVRLEKRLPRGVVIYAEQAVPLASVEIGGTGGYYTISHKGRILEKTENPKDCVTIIGYEPDSDNIEIGGYTSSSDERKTALLFEIINAIEKTELYGINEINITDQLNITLSFEERITLVLGSTVSLEQKLKNAREMFKTEIAENDRGLLRLTNLQKITFLPEKSEEIQTTAESAEEENEKETSDAEQ